MEEPDSLENKQAILEYWTLVEFFSPYILENTLNHKQYYQKIYADKPSNEPLPWLNAQIIGENDPALHLPKDTISTLDFLASKKPLTVHATLLQSSRVSGSLSIGKDCADGKLHHLLCTAYSHHPWHSSVRHAHSFNPPLGPRTPSRWKRGITHD